MEIRDFIADLLGSMPTDGWSQMSRAELVQRAKRLGVDDPELCADACFGLGIGEPRPRESVYRVKVTFEHDIWECPCPEYLATQRFDGEKWVPYKSVLAPPSGMIPSMNCRRPKSP